MFHKHQTLSEWGIGLKTHSHCDGEVITADLMKYFQVGGVRSSQNALCHCRFSMEGTVDGEEAELPWAGSPLQTLRADWRAHISNNSASVQTRTLHESYEQFRKTHVTLKSSEMQLLLNWKSMLVTCPHCRTAQLRLTGVGNICYFHFLRKEKTPFIGYTSNCQGWKRKCCRFMVAN